MISLEKDGRRHFIRKIPWIVAAFIIIAMGNTCGSSDVQDTHVLSNTVQTISIDLFKQLSSGDISTNLFFSPLSIVTALGLTHLGSRNATARQLNEVFGLPVDDNNLHSSVSSYANILSRNSSYILKLANRIYTHNKFKILDQYRSDVVRHYKSEVVPAYFGLDSAREATNINNWVEQQTAGKIRNLIQGDSLNDNTAAVIVNAVYFKGDWHQKFEKSATAISEFFVKRDSKTAVDMMQIEDKFKFGRDEKLRASILDLPYVKKDLSMYVVLPDETDGLDHVIQNIDKGFFSGLKEMRTARVSVQLPKFKLENSFDLAEHLTKLGVRDLFQSGVADLSGIDGTNQLFVSKAIHKSFIEVNEDGSEAAAATGHVIAVRSVPMIESFIADHPFLFFILDNRADMVLFMGRFSQPESSAERRDEL